MDRMDKALSARIDGVLAKAVGEKRIVGAVVQVARNGALVARRAVGMADRAKGVPMRVTFAPPRALDPASYPSGGAGLVGTAGDFFCAFSKRCVHATPSCRRTGSTR